jgi:23S rRNA (uridine2552-2'-O)-methyltransferase
MPRRFVAERRRDPFYRAAQRDGLRSRAAFKLEHLDRRFRLFAPGDRVLDLGAAPGGWSIVASRAVGRRGRVVAVDLRRIDPIEGVEVVHGRVGDPELGARLGPAPFSVVLSDLSPAISGAYATDHARSVALVRDAWRLAERLLAPGGTFVAKVFDGELVRDVEEELGRAFERVQRTKPPASREASSELYLVARGRRAPAAGPRSARPAAVRASDI